MSGDAVLSAPGPVTLLLLSHAGGGGELFRDWLPLLPHWIRPRIVVLPGRGRRRMEPALREWPALIDRLAADAGAGLDGPFALLGHSLGALVALELAHRLRNGFGDGPAWLCAAACGVPAARQRRNDWLHCSDETLVDELRALGGTPPELLDNRELLELVLPTLRADFHLADSYERPERAPLSLPMLILGGSGDRAGSSTAAALSGWRRETTGRTRITLLPGGHFFPRDSRDAVIALAAEDLSTALGNREPVRV